MFVIKIPERLASYSNMFVNTLKTNCFQKLECESLKYCRGTLCLRKIVCCLWDLCLYFVTFLFLSMLHGTEYLVWKQCIMWSLIKKFQWWRFFCVNNFKTHFKIKLFNASRPRERENGSCRKLYKITIIFLWMSVNFPQMMMMKISIFATPKNGNGIASNGKRVLCQKSLLLCMKTFE